MFRNKVVYTKKQEVDKVSNISILRSALNLEVRPILYTTFSIKLKHFFQKQPMSKIHNSKLSRPSSSSKSSRSCGDTLCEMLLKVNIHQPSLGGFTKTTNVS